MENNNSIVPIIAVIIILILIFIFLNNTGAFNKELETITDSDTATASETTSISTITETATTPSNEITLTKTIPVYYLQLPKQIGYPSTPSSNAVSNVTLPKGKTLTISKVWDFGSGSIYYETTEKVLYLSNPSAHGLGDYYLVKKFDI